MQYSDAVPDMSSLEDENPEKRVLILKQEKLKAKTAFTKLAHKLRDILEDEGDELPSRSMVKEVLTHLDGAQEKVVVIMDRLSKEYKSQNEEISMQNVETEMKHVKDQAGMIRIQAQEYLESRVDEPSTVASSVILRN